MSILLKCRHCNDHEVFTSEEAASNSEWREIGSMGGILDGGTRWNPAFCEECFDKL